jgi:pimeloyl-ACP methyl ester carboxylesterase
MSSAATPPMEAARATVRVTSQDLALNVVTVGQPTRPPVVMVHGIRDVAMSLVPIAERLADEFFVVLPDLRGHGDSAKPGHYAMPQFVYDLHRVVAELRLDRPAILGHSLGGHIVAHYAALFPEVPRALAVVEGLGPPDRPHDADPRARLVAQRAQLLATMAIPSRTRPLPGVDFAAERLMANNHRLTAAHARWLAEHCTETGDDGKLYWKFDPRAGELWLGVEHDANRHRWRAIACPVLVVTGGQAHEYWTAQMPIPGWDGRYREADLAARLACFAEVEHVHLEQAGHMVHFDAPDDLAAAVRAFFQRRNP